MVYKSARNTSRILGVALVCFLFSFFFRLINIDFFLLFPPSVYEDCGEDLPNICTLTDMGCVSVCKLPFDDCSMSLTIFVCSLLQTQPGVWTQVIEACAVHAIKQTKNKYVCVLVLFLFLKNMGEDVWETGNFFFNMRGNINCIFCPLCWMFKHATCQNYLRSCWCTRVRMPAQTRSRPRVPVFVCVFVIVCMCVCVHARRRVVFFFKSLILREQFGIFCWMIRRYVRYTLLSLPVLLMMMIIIMIITIINLMKTMFHLAYFCLVSWKWCDR